MKRNDERLKLIPPGAELLAGRHVDCGPAPASGWFHFNAPAMQGAAAAGNGDLARKAMGIDVRTWAAVQLAGFVYQTPWPDSPPPPTPFAYAQEVVRETIALVDLLLAALNPPPPPAAG